MTYGYASTKVEDKVAALACRTCGETMNVKRNVNGPTGFAEAMSHAKHLHDAHSCPFRDEMWHKQVHKLHEEATRCSSKRLADIMEGEAQEILTTRKETKQVSLL